MDNKITKEDELVMIHNYISQFYNSDENESLEQLRDEIMVNIRSDYDKEHSTILSIGNILEISGV